MASRARIRGHMCIRDLIFEILVRMGASVAASERAEVEGKTCFDFANKIERAFSWARS